MNIGLVSSPEQGRRIGYVLLITVALGITFQIGHFVEHAVQFGMWLFSNKSVAWMSPWAMWLVHQIGHITVPQATHARQMAVGMELLHLIGNSIFLATLGGMYTISPRRCIRWALYVEGFHLCEHIMLTLSILLLGKAMGLSTLFGYSSMLWGPEGAVGYRVFWHFALNLVPSVMVMGIFMRNEETARQPMFV